MASPHTHKRRTLLIRLSVAIAAVLALALLILILALTVFKARHPVISVNSIAVSDLNFAVDVARLRLHFNVSLDTNITVRNPNRVGFKYANSSALLRFRGDDVGEVPIPAGEIGARDTRNLDLTLALMTDRLIFDSDFYREAITGTLHFETFIRMAGKVRVVFDFHVVSYTSCDLEIHLSTRMVFNQTCRYKVKL
ncbi:uncharacterized protein LOC131025543 [Salvia miltiorrhiza]|uniref:uncharacterized protein LOC131025543 n=1 Tax=Salvia miltiorrhiza TaxID=226208 RepID=UPI0025AD5CC7|nr:uncharacterized protein LOC131025543 [Salvia miltiorrhiza]